MAAVENRPSNHSLYDFFEDDKSKHMKQKTVDFEIENSLQESTKSSRCVTASPAEKECAVDVAEKCISTTPRKFSEHELDKEQSQPEDSETRTPSKSESRNRSRNTSAVSNYSEDFSSCLSSPRSVRDDSEDSDVEVKNSKREEPNRAESKTVKFREKLTEEICHLSANKEAFTNDADIHYNESIDIKSPESSFPDNEIRKIQSDHSLRRQSAISQDNIADAENQSQVIRCTLTPVRRDTPNNRQSRIITPHSPVRHTTKPQSTSQEANDQRLKTKGTQTPLNGDIQSSLQSENISPRSTSRQKDISEGTTSRQSLKANLETPHGEIKRENETECKEADYIRGFVERIDVKPTGEILKTTEDVKPETQKETSATKSNVRAKNITNKFRQNRKPVARKPVSRIQKENECPEKHNHRLDKKSVLASGQSPPTNNNSKSKLKRKNVAQRKDDSVETSGIDSRSEAVVDILKIGSNSSYTQDEFTSHSDQLLMGSSTSGHSFNSRFTTSTLQNSPYNSSRLSSVSKRNYNPTGRLSLPSINKTVPGQLVRGSTCSLKRNSDSDVSTKLPTKKQQDRKPIKPNVMIDTTRAAVVQKIGDHKKPKVPIKLKAEAMLRDGHLEVSVTDREDVEIGTNNLNVKLTLVHKFIEQKPRILPKCPQRLTNKRQNIAQNREIIKQRAMWPPFNTYTNAEASERYYNRFKS